MTAFFTELELATLREHGIVIFAQRVIFEAQPPMPAEDLIAIREVCSGDIPKPLTDLWLTTAGGRLDYDLTVKMQGQEEAISFCELFYKDSNGYHTLQGWMEHEANLSAEAAEENGAEWDGLLRYLPFGGFEYCDRVYVRVETGPKYGEVIAWKMGLPAAWTHCLHQDSVSAIGTDLYEAFQNLVLHCDPMNPTDTYFAGQRLFEYLDDRVENHGLSETLQEKLIAFYCQAFEDWRSSLKDGTLAQNSKLAKTALIHAIKLDDVALIKELAAAKIRMDEPVQGSALPTEVALMQSSYAAARALVEAGSPVTSDILDNFEYAVPADLIMLLIEKGAEPTVHSIVKSAACGAEDSALAIARAYRKNDLKKSFAKAKKASLDSLEEKLTHVRSGNLVHWLGEEGLVKRIESLERFSLD
ncbi:MAG: SMI1/KNR4 family protein [Cyanobacteria bacterium]|nr:SMI1/KNR4 family protein [Cyanobacteriota bacterium]